MAYTIFSYALSKASASLVTVYLYTVPVFSLLFSWLSSVRFRALLTLFGGAVAVAGIVVVNWAKRRDSFRTESGLRPS